MIDSDTLHRVYGCVTFARQLDEKVQLLVRSGGSSTSWFSWCGTELLGAAVGLSLRTDDYLAPYYRDVASQLAKGSSPKSMCAEVLGKATGYQKGKSGWVHTIDLAAGVVVNSGVVGGHLPIAAGWALSSVLRGDGRVTLCTFGDGAVNEGAFHEALTLASIWKLPVVFVCYNNLYAEHTAFRTTSPVDRVADRSAAYAIPGVTVDGGDIVATWDALVMAIDRARSGDGPTLIEAIIPRPRGHTRYDDLIYGLPDDISAHIAADPVPRFRAWMIAEGHASEDELTALDKKGAEEVEEAWKFAESSPYPDPSDLYSDVYAAP